MVLVMKYQESFQSYFSGHEPDTNYYFQSRKCWWGMLA